jgi:hypothetical protein
MVKILFKIGIVLTLLGAAIMFEENLFGNRTLSIAIVLGIIGLCLIARNSDNNMKNWWKNE